MAAAMINLPLPIIVIQALTEWLFFFVSTPNIEQFSSISLSLSVPNFSVWLILLWSNKTYLAPVILFVNLDIFR